MDDLLLTFAEIAVAFVGFASIAAVLARHHAGLRLQMLLIYSLLPLFLLVANSHSDPDRPSPSGHLAIG